VTAIAIVWRAGVTAALVCAAVSLGAGVVRWHVHRRDEPARVAVATVVLGAALVGAAFAWAAAVRVDALDRHPFVALYGTSTVVTVTASEQPRPLRGGGRVVFRAALRRIGADDASGRVSVFASARGFAELTTGRPATFRAFVARPTRRDMSVGVLTATGTPTLGEASPIQRAAESVRRRFADAARAELPADQAAALPALVLGDTSTLPPETVASFKAAGLTHLTAVSGANVTIVCGAVLLSAGLVGPRVAVVLAALALVGFVIVVQPSASVLRAAVMGAIALLGVLAHRRRHAMPALAATVIALMIVAPEMSVDLGFALSVSATAALIVIAPAWSRGMVLRGWPKPVADTVCVATAAQLVTAPLIAGISGRVSVVSIVANVAVTAVIPPITVAGTAAAALAPLWPSGAHLLIRFTGPELCWLLGVARWAGGIPGATVEVPSRLLGFVIVAVGGVGSVLLWRRLRRMRWAWPRRSAMAPSSGELDGTASGTGRRRTPRRPGDRGGAAPGAGPGTH
jgi:competence protein ComEC